MSPLKIRIPVNSYIRVQFNIFKQMNSIIDVVTSLLNPLDTIAKVKKSFIRGSYLKPSLFYPIDNELQDHRTLSSYNIQKGSIIFIKYLQDNTTETFDQKFNRVYYFKILFIFMYFFR